MKLYFYADTRLLFPLLVLATPLMAAGAARALRERAERPVAAIFAGLLLAAAVVGIPAREGLSEAADLLEVRTGAAPAHRVMEQFEQLHTASPRLVLTDLISPYLHALSEPGIWVAPLFDDHLYRFNPARYRFEDRERRRLVVRALAEGREIWAVTAEHDIREIHRLHPPPRGHAWEIIAAGPASGIARLVHR